MFGDWDVRGISENPGALAMMRFPRGRALAASRENLPLRASACDPIGLRRLARATRWRFCEVRLSDRRSGDRADLRRLVR